LQNLIFGIDSYVVPDAFTHGSSEQRTRWFNAGLKSGKVQGCHTFNAAQL
jgi:predicted metalloprotease